MKLLFPLIPLLILSSCSRLSELKHNITPDEWLASHPYWNVSLGSFNFIFAEPSSTFFVFSLGVILLIIGIILLKKNTGEKTVSFWSWAFIAWALSTFSAGTSYQAFSYEIKCAGKDICSWTSWWEIVYLMLFVMAVNMIIIAVAHSSTKGKLRKSVIAYALLNCTSYTILLLTGAFLPDHFFVSFEFMILFTCPAFIILSVVNFLAYRARNQKLDIRLLFAWIFMFAIVILYFGFLVSGYAAVLWQKGIWFNANDVLHISLIIWAIYLYFGVSRYFMDYK
jgi:hypothetical protein